MKTKLKNKPFIMIWGAFLAVIIGVIIALNCVAVFFDAALKPYFGIIGGDVVGGVGVDGNNDLEYYKTSSKNADEFHAAEVALCEQITGEGAVLLKNDGNALPLVKGNKVSVFGGSSANMLTGGTGSGSTIETESISLKTVLETAGFVVNPTLWTYYSGLGKNELNGPGKPLGSASADWNLREPSISSNATLKASYSSYSAAAIVVLSRAAGEGMDLPRNMQDYGGEVNRHYLEITEAEINLIKEVNANFGKVIVMINAANAMELGFLNDETLGIDACLAFAGTGSVGLSAIGGILCGDINPSGRLVDTYAYDSLSSPAMQNFGDFLLKNTNASTGQSFIAEAESIYVGYKYYETRYEDKVLGRTKVGTYNYDDEVQFTFGYGLSYSDFEWSNFEMSKADSDGNIKITLDVKNISERKGKDVVELYLSIRVYRL